MPALLQRLCAGWSEQHDVRARVDRNDTDEPAAAPSAAAPLSAEPNQSRRPVLPVIHGTAGYVVRIASAAASDHLPVEGWRTLLCNPTEWCLPQWNDLI